MNITGMNKADMVKVLENMHDFKVQKTRVEELISKHGHKCIFLPKCGVKQKNLHALTAIIPFLDVRKQSIQL